MSDIKHITFESVSHESQVPEPRPFQGQTWFGLSRGPGNEKKPIKMER